MQIGAVFPQTEIGSDPGGIRAYAQAAAELGFAHLLAYDHVLGADPQVHEGWTGYYDISDPFHEPMALFGYLAAVCPLELVTGVLIAPQRQTALVAKQAAAVDVLSGGRLRLGLGLGWNHVEYQALGRAFENRGQRLDEQIELLRLLWTRPSVTFEGRFDTVRGAGIAPLPVQRPIPIWLGAVAPAALARVGRLADGWLPQVPPGPRLEQSWEIVSQAAKEAGRDPATVGIEGRLEWSVKDRATFERHVDKWRATTATHLSVNTMRAGLVGPDRHIEALQAAAEVLFDGH